LAFSVCALAGLWSHVTYHYDSLALETAAHRIGVTPTFKDIVQYVETSVRSGMSRQRVEETLQQVAPLELLERGEWRDVGGLGLTACDRLRLKIGPFYAQYGLTACYDSGDHLLNLQFEGFVP
jgi:hypothetical protein